jgi:uncharacterized membrane-anchored protein YhcB (DUF1043 family)
MIYLTFALWPYAVGALVVGVAIGWMTAGAPRLS